MRHDPRAAFLVESGRAWTELAAVHVTGELTIVSDRDVRAAAIAGLDESTETSGCRRSSYPRSPGRPIASARSCVCIQPNPQLGQQPNIAARLIGFQEATVKWSI